LALSIAKERGFALLTGDKALRNAGEAAGVKVKGTLWVFDELNRQDCITDSEYHRYMVALRDYNGKSIRLPASEIHKRLEQFSK
jgi:predicted nucleic acid-binding protein